VSGDRRDPFLGGQLNNQPSPQLAEVVARVRDRISKLRGDKGFNEQNTKASLIVPVLQALGWDTNDSDEVHWEYKPKPRYNPVDFALMLQRTPCLFVEAKALRENLEDDKLLAQILTYASVAGVQWVVLTNGDEYRIYNAAALVPVDEKRFRTVTISSDAQPTIAATLSLLSKSDLEDKKIARLWESDFIDRQVKTAIEALFNPDQPAKSLLSAVRKATNGKLRDSEIRASLRRARVHLDFPEPIALSPPIEPTASKRRGVRGRNIKQSEAVTSVVSLQAIMGEGLLRPPVELTCKYRGHDLRATLESDGSILLDGVRYDSPSIAAGMARKPFYKGNLKGKGCPSTNGWTFWQVHDPTSRDMVPLDAFRGRYLQKKKSQAAKFTGQGA